MGEPYALIETVFKEVAHEFGVDEQTRCIYLLGYVLQPEFPEARILNFFFNFRWFLNAPIVTAKQIGERLLAS